MPRKTMRTNGIVITFVIFVTVSQINGKTEIFRILENTRGVENYLKPLQGRRHLLNNLIDMLTASSKYNVTIYLIKNKQSEETNKKYDYSFVDLYDKLKGMNHESRKSVFTDKTEEKKKMGDTRTVLDLLNKELNKRIFQMGVGRSMVPHED